MGCSSFYKLGTLLYRNFQYIVFQAFCAPMSYGIKGMGGASPRGWRSHFGERGNYCLRAAPCSNWLLKLRMRSLVVAGLSFFRFTGLALYYSRCRNASSLPGTGFSSRYDVLSVVIHWGMFGLSE